MANGNEPEWFAGQDDAYSWSIAGYVPIGETFSSGYVNFDPDSPGTRVEHTEFTNWDFLPHTDYAVAKITTASGDTYYTQLAGPFEDLEDFGHAVADWWEEGS
jgi:hypothetical protein